MGLMETLNYLVELCISIQKTLDAMTQYFKDATVLHRSLIDLSALDVAALETNVKLLAGYSEDIEYIISVLERLSGNIRVVFWLVVIAVIIAVVAVIIVLLDTFYTYRESILNWIKEKFKK